MKKICVFLIVLAMLLSMVACGEAANTQTSQSGGDGYTAIPFLKDYTQYKYTEHINVLYLVCTTAAEYFPNSNAIWKPMMEKRNISIDLMGPGVMTDANLIDMLETQLESKKYDLVLLYPTSPAAITPLLDGIWKDYHVPVLAYAFDPSTKCGHYYLGTSYYHAGEVLGQSIIEYVNKNKDYFGKLNTIPYVVYMHEQAVDQYERVKAVKSILDKDGRFKMITEVAANMEEPCMKATETLLTSNPEVEIIVTQIDNDVTGALSAINSGTYKHSDYLSLWGFDATGAVMSKMSTDGAKGHAQGSSFIDHYQSGEALCEIIPILVGAAKQGKLIEFKPDEQKWLGTALSNYYLTVTPANVNKYYTPKK